MTNHNAYFDMARRFVEANAPASQDEPEVGHEIPVEATPVRSAAAPDPHETKLQGAEKHEELGDRQYREIQRISPVTLFVNTLACFGAVALPGIVIMGLPKSDLVLKLVTGVPIMGAIACLVMGMRYLSKIGNDRILVNRLSVVLSILIALNFSAPFVVWALAFRK